MISSARLDRCGSSGNRYATICSRPRTGHGGSSNDQLRARANSLVLRATQAALAATKGAGYVVGHPAGRWCREALFFLVWSCPQPVVQVGLCELAGYRVTGAA